MVQPGMTPDKEQALKAIAEKRNFPSQNELLQALRWHRRKLHVLDELKKEELITIDTSNRALGYRYKLSGKGIELAQNKGWLPLMETEIDASATMEAKIKRILSKYLECTQKAVESEYGAPIDRKLLLRIAKELHVRIYDKVIPLPRFAGIEREPSESAYW